MDNNGVKISIIGAGFVGATAAYAMMMGGIASEMVIVDINKDKAEGEAMDLAHGISFVKPVDIISGTYEDTKDSDIVIITAGAGQKPGETRLDLINKNYNILKGIVPEVAKYSPNSILLVVSNPVDILTYATYKLSGFPKERVIGSGTVLDTSRFRYLLGEHFGIDTRNVHTYILGEHGDSEIAAWSLTNVAGVPVEEYCATICKGCPGNFKKDRKSTRLNSSHANISYAVFCLKKTILSLRSPAVWSTGRHAGRTPRVRRSASPVRHRGVPDDGRRRHRRLRYDLPHVHERDGRS